MYPKSYFKPYPKQRGSMLVVALFVIVVFSLLGLTMTRLLSASSENIIYEVLGQRALNAARSGLEFCLAGKYPVDDEPACSNPESGTFTGIDGLNDCQYEVDISEKTVTDNGRTYTYVSFSSEGRCDAGEVIVTRKVYVDSMVQNP